MKKILCLPKNGRQWMLPTMVDEELEELKEWRFVLFGNKKKKKKNTNALEH